MLFDALGVMAGDLDSGGFVGITDLNIVLSNWNHSIPPGNPSLGDPSGDGFVGIADLNLVLGNWNTGSPPTSDNSLPEPSALALLALGSACLIHRNSSSPCVRMP